MNRLKFLIAALMIYCVVLTGCPSAKTIADAKKGSIKIATYSDLAANLTRDLYRSNFISLSQKDAIADAFIVLNHAGIAFDKAVANAETVYGSDVPAGELDRLFATFDADVIAKFLAAVALIKPLQHAGEYVHVVELLKTAVLAVAKAFSKHSQVQAKLATV